MPELPEVETIVRDLRPHLQGRTLTGVRVGEKPLRRPWSPNDALAGRTIEAVERRGKWILLGLGDPWLLIHLGMTGQLTLAAPGQPTESHTHAVFGLSPDGATGLDELRFRDIRRFGSIGLYASRAELESHFEAMRLGPEPMDLKPAAWRCALAKTSRNLKAILLDQTVLAGVGNIYADEALFEAKLAPTLSGRQLTAAEAERLRRAVQRVLQRAIARRGSTIRNYVGGSGLKGGYQLEFRVYARKGQPCSRCTALIEMTRLAGRASHFCPRCQTHRSASNRAEGRA